MLGIIYLQIPL